MRLALRTLLAALCLVTPALAQQQPVVIGTPNSGQGDTPRSAFTKLNQNDADLYARFATLAAQLAATTSPNLATGTILSNLGASGTAPVGNTLSALLDNSIGLTRATIPVRGASGWGALTPTASGCTFQFNGTDTVCASASPGTGAVRYDATQGLSADQQAQARSNIAGAASGGNSDITALSGLTTPLSVAQGGTAASNAPAARTNLGVAASGANTDITSLASPALGSPTMTTQTAGDNSTRGATTAFVGAAVAPAPTITSSNTTLSAADVERPIIATGTPTITAANGGSGWRSGTIRNANTLTGTITLAVPSGATLDGTTNGTTPLLPYQRARIIQTGATAYITDWIDRSPIVSKATITSAVASVDLAMPAGYSSFEMIIGGLRVDTSGVTLSARFSTDSGSTVLSAASSYYNVVTYGLNTSSTAQFGYGASTGVEVASSLSNGFQALTAQGLVYPGSANYAPSMAFKSSFVDSANNLFGKDYSGRYTVGPVTANLVRFSPSSGNITGGTIIFRGIAP